MNSYIGLIRTTEPKGKLNKKAKYWLLISLGWTLVCATAKRGNRHCHPFLWAVTIPNVITHCESFVQPTELMQIVNRNV